MNPDECFWVYLLFPSVERTYLNKKTPPIAFILSGFALMLNIV